MKLIVLKMKIRTTLSLCILCSLIFLNGCGHNDLARNANFSQLYGSSDFCVVSDELGTSAQGTILISRRGQNVLNVRIVAFIHIGAEDWGGIAFYCPNGCNLNDILCTYPDNPEFWFTESDDVEYTLAIELGRARACEPIGGGAGTVVIDLSYPCDDTNPTSELKFAVECGAGYENEQIVWGTAHDEIVVKIKCQD